MSLYRTWRICSKVGNPGWTPVLVMSARKMSDTSGTCKIEARLVVTEKRGDVFLIGINRPHVRNCVNHQTALQLFNAFQTFENDETSLAAVFYGRGGTFCAGYDLKEVASTAGVLEDIGEAEVGPMGGEAQVGPMGPSRMQLSKPVIAAVDGYAVAGGMELALFADLRVVEEDAIMGVFCRRFGVPLLDGGTVRLPRLIGLSRALDLILTGRPIGAQEALEFGLANRVVPKGTALEAAVELANQIAAFPQECMRADRRSAYHGMFDSGSFAESMKFEFRHGKGIVAKESVKGAKRFTEGVGRGGSFDQFKPRL
ncbi:short-chain-enoyl-CoA hydratase-like isoform X1 [Branchiostoma floridae]|uniref:Short-chain-enoyl-CoA hydratase-like isoform X1 n=2 Tax=Branchiostoma floridae TaxID=7739 RepID=A0A9J7HU12_BRAFL|nr:short-chain-enoyl-CoA hydratase-like isoform X1 [Branchiostoma floridae]